MNRLLARRSEAGLIRTLLLTLTILLGFPHVSWAGCANPAPLNKPTALAFDKHGFLYLANSSANQILVFSVQRTLFNMVGNGGLTQANCIVQGLNQPTGLAFDPSWNLFVANQGSNSVTVYAANPNTVTTAFTQITNETLLAGVASPLAVAVDSQQNVYVANSTTNSIAEFVHQSSGGQPFTPAPGSPFTTDSGGQSLLGPSALYFDPADQLLVIGLSGNAVSQLRFIKTFPNFGAPYQSFQQYPVVLSCSPTSLPGVSAIATTGAGLYNGITFINYGPDRQITANGGVLGLRNIVSNGSPCSNNIIYSTNLSSLTSPSGIVVDPFSNIFVSDAKSNHIYMYYAGVAGPPICQY